MEYQIKQETISRIEERFQIVISGESIATSLINALRDVDPLIEDEYYCAEIVSRIDLDYYGVEYRNK